MNYVLLMIMSFFYSNKENKCKYCHVTYHIETCNHQFVYWPYAGIDFCNRCQYCGISR